MVQSYYYQPRTDLINKDFNKWILYQLQLNQLSLGLSWPSCVSTHITCIITHLNQINVTILVHSIYPAAHISNTLSDKVRVRYVSSAYWIHYILFSLRYVSILYMVIGYVNDTFHTVQQGLHMLPHENWPQWILKLTTQNSKKTKAATITWNQALS
jgi:hypothetical protein